MIYEIKLKFSIEFYCNLHSLKVNDKDLKLYSDIHKSYRYSRVPII